MSREDLNRYLKEKWSNYSYGLAMAMSFRENKNYTFQDVNDAFTSGFYEFEQILHRNNIKLEDLKFD